MDYEEFGNIYKIKFNTPGAEQWILVKEENMICLHLHRDAMNVY